MWGKTNLMQTGNDDRAQLYTKYHDKVFGYVMNRLQNRAEAEDVTSDVFLKLYSRPEKIEIGREGVSTYVFKVTQSVLYDHYRKNKDVCAPLDDVAHFDDTGDLDEMLEYLNDALDTISVREKEIVILHYYDGLDHKEIALRMGLSYTNVRQICHVALKKLKSAMEESMNGGKRKMAIDDDDLPSVTGGLKLEYAGPSLGDAKDKTVCGNI